MNEYLKVTIVVEKSGRWVGNRPLRFSEFVSGEVSEEVYTKVRLAISN